MLNHIMVQLNPFKGSRLQEMSLRANGAQEKNISRRAFLTRTGLFVTASGLLLSGPGQLASAASAAASTQKLFGVDETRSSNMRAFTKWKGMWLRHRTSLDQEAAAIAVPDVTGRPLSPLERAARQRDKGYSAKDLDQFVLDQRTLPVTGQIRSINSFINIRRYIIDPVNWGLPDYWATPQEFFRKDGDCEDYAITKYILLKKLGFSVDSMRIVIVQDENLKVAHAVLAVYVEDDILVLDNQFNRPLSHTKIHHYRPVYSINETSWWLHQNGLG